MFFQSNSSLSTPQYLAYVVAKIVRFSIHASLLCLIVSSSLRFVSLVKMSEEAGIQFFGPDNVAIKKVRFIALSTCCLISLVLMQDNHSIEAMMYPNTNVREVISNFTNFK